MARIRIVMLTVALSACAVSGGAQGAPPTPPTQEEKMMIQQQLLKLENAQLRVRVVAAELDKVKMETTVLLQQFIKDGFELDLQTYTYKPASKPVKK